MCYNSNSMSLYQVYFYKLLIFNWNWVISVTRVPWLVKNNECSIYFNSRVLFGNLISLDLQFISSSDTKALLIIDVQFIRNNVFQFIVLDCNWCFVLNKMIHNEPSRTMPNMLTCTKFLAYWLFNDLYFLLTLIRYYLLR